MKKENTETWSLFGKAEQCALKFFQSEEVYPHAKSPNRIKKLFSEHDRSIDFILFEGSLKADLLRSGLFSAEEISVLQEDSLGRQSFCQCAEFFMNAFKLGHTTPGFPFHKYLVPIDPEKPFEPLSTSVVFYPKSYEELYSLESPIAHCFRKCFGVVGDKVSDITCWHVTYEGGGK